MVARNGHVAVIKQLIAARTKIECRTRNDKPPLYLAAAEGHTAAVAVLIKADAKVDVECGLWYDLDTPLCCAASNGDIDMVRQLIRAGADVNVKCREEITPLVKAAAHGNIAVMQILANAGARLPQKFSVCLFAGVELNSPAYLTALITADADLNITHEGKTPLHNAIQKGNKAVVKTLLAANANYMIIDEKGTTAAALAKELWGKDNPCYKAICEHINTTSDEPQHRKWSTMLR